MTLRDQLTPEERQELQHLMRVEPMAASDFISTSAALKLSQRDLIQNDPQTGLWTVNWDHITPKPPQEGFSA